MQKFALRLLLFLLPFAVLFIFPLFVLFASGELLPVESIIRYQEQDKPLIVGLAYSDPWGYVKMESTLRRKPEVIVIGSSRVMQFRSSFFKRSFYNASKGAATTRHFLRFLKKIPPSQSPKLMIAGLDQEFFSPGWIWTSSREIDQKPSSHDWLRIFGKSWTQVYWDFYQDKFKLHDFLNPDAGFKKIGLFAVSKSTGFMNDASYLYGEFLKSKKTLRHKQKIQESLRYIREGKDKYAYGSDVRPRSLANLKAFFKEARRRKIHLIVYLPPFSPEVYREIKKKKDRYGYMFALPEKIESLARKHDVQFFDFTDPSLVGARQSEFYDDVHDGGTVTFRIFRKMMEKDKVLRQAAAASPAQINVLKNISGVAGGYNRSFFG